MNNNEINVQEIDDVVVDFTTVVREAVEAVGTPTLTMYALANVLSKFTTSRVREQMMYNYRTKNRFAKYGIVGGRLPVDGAVEFIVKFVARANALSNLD